MCERHVVLLHCRDSTAVVPLQWHQPARQGRRLWCCVSEIQIAKDAAQRQGRQVSSDVLARGAASASQRQHQLQCGKGVICEREVFAV